MFRLAHISDPHLGPLPPLVRRELGLKQRLGYLNWQKNRVGSFDATILSAVIADMKSSDPGHIAVTGDLINLGLDSEIANAGRWLSELGEPADVSVVPGNHDAYIPSAVGAYTSAWRMYLHEHGPKPGRFPTMRRRGPVAIIGISTAVPTAPLMATGRVEREQLEALGPLLTAARAEGLCRVIMIHHPPDSGGARWHKRLVNSADLRAVLARYGAEVILHGHNHRNRQATVPGLQAPIPVVGVAATAMRCHHDKPGGSWNMLSIETNGDGFTIDLATRGWASPGMLKTLLETRLSA